MDWCGAGVVLYGATRCSSACFRMRYQGRPNRSGAELVGHFVRWGRAVLGLVKWCGAKGRADCGKKRSALHRSTQRTASAIAARCIAQRNALHQPSHRTAFPVPQQHLLSDKQQVLPRQPSPARLGQTSKQPLTTAPDTLQHGTLTRPIAPAASTSLPLLSPAVSQPYKIRCAE